MNRRDEEALTAQIEADLHNPDAWEDDPAPMTPPLRTLGSVISVRLTSELADRVRAIAAAKGVRYTSLIRTWITERVARSAVVTVSEERFSHAGVATAQDTTHNLFWSNWSGI